MVERVVFQRGKLPPASSDYMKRFARHLWDYALYLMDGRKDRDVYVRECDLAYACRRFVPDVGAIELLEDGEFGETDIFDITNTISIRLALALMDRNKRWLTAATREGELEKTVQATEDWNIWTHSKARTRRNMQRVFKQAHVRGRTGFYWDWHEDVVYQRLDRTDNPAQLAKFLARSGMSLRAANEFSRGKYEIVKNAGPRITPIDYYDLWIDQITDIVNDRRPAKMLRRFYRLDQLKNTIDDNDEPVYDIPENWEGYRLEDIWNRTEHAGGRLGSERIFNSNHSTLPPYTKKTGVQLTPVFIMYFPYYKFEDQRYWDTYFYLARNSANEEPRIIRVEENPDDLGHSHIIVEDYIDQFTATAHGGISGVEKLVGKYHQKNLLQLLTITAAAHSIFPAQLAYEDIFRTDDEVSFAPGALNVLAANGRPIRDVIAPVQTPDRGMVLGEQALRFAGDELRATSGIEGLGVDSPSRTISQPKTATEIDRDTTSGGYVLDNLAENFADMLTEYCQAVYETAQQRMTGDENGMLQYERYLGDKMLQSEISIQDFMKKRSIAVLGARGDLNRNQDLNNHFKAFEITGQLQDPRVQAFRVQLMVRICEKLNIEVPEILRNSNPELMAQLPEVQMAVINQVTQDPNVIQMFQQGGQLSGTGTA